jgi:predicted GIY-YIG superfamily endonuclease
MGSSSPPFLCYLVESPSAGRTYVGITNNLTRRLRQHRGELVGGAKATTRAAADWRVGLTVAGFQSHRQALQFEWAFKHARGTGAEARVGALHRVVCAERWTRASPLARDVPLAVSVRSAPLFEACSRMAWPPHVSLFFCA